VTDRPTTDRPDPRDGAYQRRQAPPVRDPRRQLAKWHALAAAVARYAANTPDREDDNHAQH